MINLFDTHCHIDFQAFDHDRDAVIKSCNTANVSQILVPAVSQALWLKTIEVCQHYKQCQLALGLHPIFIEQHQPQHLIELDQLIHQYQPVAVGEIGLDYYRKDLDRQKQKLFFAKQLVIAKQHELPVIIHNRKAHDECLELLKELNIRSGIIHAFNGSFQQAEKYIEQGMLLGFGGMLTFERSRKLRALAKRIPIESIVLETDAPDMTVVQHKGQRNSPEYIPYILQALADIKSQSIEKISRTTFDNAERLFFNPN